MTVRGTAHVPTATPDRYAKQLASHLGRRCEVREEATGTRLLLAGGECLLRPKGDVLELHAAAPTEEALGHVQSVVANHLERFGQRNEFRVAWAEG